MIIATKETGSTQRSVGRPVIEKNVANGGFLIVVWRFGAQI